MNFKQIHSITLFISVFVFGCSSNPETFIEHLNGYWEIDQVTLANGTKRDYNYNDTIDFISITDNLTGIRKKLKPGFDGTYQTSKDSEHLTIIIENDSLHIYYVTPYTEWKETVLNATKDELIIINATKDVYLYKRFVPLNLN